MVPILHKANTVREYLNFSIWGYGPVQNVMKCAHYIKFARKKSMDRNAAIELPNTIPRNHDYALKNYYVPKQNRFEESLMIP
jgi:hypothetical protein